MGVSNPAEAVLGVLNLIDQTQIKMMGTALASMPWRCTSSSFTDDQAELLNEPLARCEDVTETVIVVTVAAVFLAERERRAGCLQSKGI